MDNEYQMYFYCSEARKVTAAGSSGVSFVWSCAVVLRSVPVIWIKDKITDYKISSSLH